MTVDACEWNQDTLPEGDEYVIVSVRDVTTTPNTYYTAPGWFHNGEWIVQDCVCDGVIAWTDFPEPFV